MHRQYQPAAAASSAATDEFARNRATFVSASNDIRRARSVLASFALGFPRVRIGYPNCHASHGGNDLLEHPYGTRE